VVAGGVPGSVGTPVGYAYEPGLDRLEPGHQVTYLVGGAEDATADASAQRGLGGLLTGRTGLDEVVEEHLTAGRERVHQAGDDGGRVLLVADVVEDAAEEQPDRPTEVDRGTERGVLEEPVGIEQIALDRRDAGASLASRARAWASAARSLST
jgi:hypothetical protein